jgi:probable HAF family extracellular repeat protein
MSRRSTCILMVSVFLTAAGCSDDPPTSVRPRHVTGQAPMYTATSTALVSSLSPGATYSFASLSPGMDRAYGINDAGLVVGDYGGNPVATTWTLTGGYHEVRRLDGSTDCCSTLTHVNATGQASGWSFSDRPISAMIWTQSTDAKTDLVVPQRAFASSNNNGGDVVGYHFDLGTFFTAFFKPAAGAPVSLMPLNGAVNEFAFAVNDAGAIVGTSQLGDAGNPSRATMWSRSDAGATDLGSLGGSNSEAWSINQVGDVVGYSEVASGVRHAMLWTAQTGMVDVNNWPNGCLGASEARGINDLGVIVGTCAGRPVLWTAMQGMRALPLPSGVSLGEPHAINNLNQVVGIFNGFGGALWTITNPNVAPVLTALSLPADPVVIESIVTATATFTDANSSDTHTAVVSWGDGETSVVTASPDGGSGTVVGSHIYHVAGVYTVSVVLTDNGGLSSTLSSAANATTTYVVTYDPSGGFVTGGGWITSEAGSFIPNPSAAGKASFGFVSKYQKGATAPSGNTQFDFTTGQLSFKSTSYQWLVVSGARAQYKGSGTINGGGAYGFLLTVIDGDVTGGGGTDRFRIKIWDTPTGNVVYDSQAGASDDTPPTTALGGGSIVLHK